MIDQFAGDVGEWEKGNRMTVLFIIREHEFGAVLYGRFYQQRDDQHKSSAKGPPEVERAHMPDCLGANGVDDARGNVHAPSDCGYLDSRQSPALSDLGQRREVEGDSQVPRRPGERHGDDVYRTRLRPSSDAWRCAYSEGRTQTAGR